MSLCQHLNKQATTHTHAKGAIMSTRWSHNLVISSVPASERFSEHGTSFAEAVERARKAIEGLVERQNCAIAHRTYTQVHHGKQYFYSFVYTTADVVCEVSLWLSNPSKLEKVVNKPLYDLMYERILDILHESFADPFYDDVKYFEAERRNLIESIMEQHQQGLSHEDRAHIRDLLSSKDFVKLDYFAGNPAFTRQWVATAAMQSDLPPRMVSLSAF